MQDALARLSAAGLIENYPDGPYKGDRVASRWEVALLVARLLARQPAAGASRADREGLQLLTSELREQLAALGVRTNNLEDSLKRLEARTADLERIKF